MERWAEKKDYLACIYPVYATDVGYSLSLLACFHLCLVSVLNTGPSLLEPKFAENFPIASVGVRGV